MACAYQAIWPFGPSPESNEESIFLFKGDAAFKAGIAGRKHHLIVTLTYYPGIMLNVLPRACPGYIANCAELPLLQVGAER